MSRSHTNRHVIKACNRHVIKVCIQHFSEYHILCIGDCIGIQPCKSNVQLRKNKKDGGAKGGLDWAWDAISLPVLSPSQ